MYARPIRPAFVAVLSIMLAGCAGGYGGRPYNGSYDRPSYNNQSQTLTCESQDGRNRSCRANMRIGRAEVDKRLSSAPCQQGRTWGYNDNRVWVDQGCRARFRIYPAGGFGGGGGHGDGGSKVIRCESDNGRRRRCDAGFDTQRVVVEKQFSNTRCEKGRTFGNDGRGVWVDGGCRADFRVYRR